MKLSLFSASLALLSGLTLAEPLSFTEAVEAGEGSYVKRDGILYKVFEDHDLGTRMEFVTDSGICETTKGVKQHSGYFTVGPNMHMWFWFFEARNNPETAPFSTWFNGGPGCSSMVGLFQENGPCNFEGNQTEPRNNPYSFNEFAHMLYVDQPIGVGFSYGTDTVTSTVTAAPFVWKLLQAFFKQFPKYRSRDFGIFTESYGGHYGPQFAYYIEQQNKAIDAGDVKAKKINLVALGVNNGFFDGKIVYKSYIDYAYKNKYKKIINKKERDQYMRKYNNHCKPALGLCKTTSNPLEDPTCAAATQICAQEIENAILGEADFDVYDVRQPADDPYPPMNFVKYLNRADVQKAIGAKPGRTFEFCSTVVGVPFLATGDEGRSFIEPLSKVVQSGVQTLIWAGDADYICNYKGGYATVQAIDFPGAKAFRKKRVKPFYTNGKHSGMFKTQGKLSWFQVFEAGHEVPYYQPEASLQVFKQTMSKKAISST